MKETGNINFNTFLLAVVIAATGAVGAKVWAQSENTAALKSTVSAVADSLARVESKIENTVPRHEYEQSARETMARVLAIETRLREMDIEIAKFKVNRKGE